MAVSTVFIIRGKIKTKISVKTIQIYKNNFWNIYKEKSHLIDYLMKSVENFKQIK